MNSNLSPGTNDARQDRADARILKQQAALLDLSADAILTRRVDGTILYWNHGAELLYGYSAAEALGRSTHELFHTQFPEPFDTIMAYLERDGVWSGDLVHTRRDGTLITVASRWAVQRDASGRPAIILESNTDITARRVVEQALETAASLPDENPNPVLRIGRHGTLLYANEASYVQLKNCDLTIGKPAPAELQALACRALDGQVALNASLEYDGRIIAFSVSPIVKSGYANLYGRDSTEENRATSSLRAAEERYRSLFNSMAEGFALHEIICDQAGKPIDYRFLDLNPAFERLTGLEREKVLGRTLNQVLPGSDPYWVEIYGKVAQTGEAVHFENYASPLNAYYEVFAYSPAPHQFAAIFLDITERKRVEQGQQLLLAQLAQERSRWEATVESMLDPVTVADAEGHAIYMNAAYSRMVNRFIGPDIDLADTAAYYQLYHADGSLFLTDDLPLQRAARLGEVVTNLEVVQRGADGAEHFFLWNAAPLRGTDGKLTGAVAIGHEITEQRRAEREREALLVRAQQARLEAERNADRLARLQRVTGAFSSALTTAEIVRVAAEEGGIVLDAPAGSVALIDETGQTLNLAHSYGFSPELTARWRSFPLSTTAPLAEAVRTRQAIWIESEEEYWTRFPDIPRERRSGQAISASLPLIANHRVIGGIGFVFPTSRPFSVRDRTFMLALADQCAQALERARLYEESQAGIRARDQFLSVTSHEIKTPLTALTGYVQLLARDILGRSVDDAQDVPLSRSDILRYLSHIQRSGERLAALVNDLLDITLIQTGHLTIVPARLDLSAVLQEEMDAFRNKRLTAYQRDMFRWQFEVAEALWGNWDPGRIRQLITILLGNAVRYSPVGGLIQVSLAREREGMAHLTIQDQGIGIPEGEQERVFLPFVTGSNAQQYNYAGVGVGLAVAREIVHQHGGSIWAENTGGGRGSRFHVLLPLAQD